MQLQVKPGFSIGGFLPYTLPAALAPETVQNSSLNNADEKWMFVAFLEGMKACGISSPNPAVGCVLVKDGVQIAAGKTEEFRSAHAEARAFGALSDRSRIQGATAYVTLEPCSHQGNQPPCTDLFLNSGISRIVIALQDPNPKVCGAGIAKLRAAGITLEVGTLKTETLLWHLPFLLHVLLKRPLWVGKWAESLAGVLADDSGNSQWITGPIARAHGHWLRQKYDAILVGANTVLKDHPHLTVRDARPPVLRQPLRLVFDPNGRISEVPPALSSTTFSMEPKTVLFLKDKPAPKGLTRATHVVSLKNEPLNSLREWAASPEAEQLFGKPLQSVYVEGGSGLLNAFLEESGFDWIHRFIGLKSPLEGRKHRVTLNRHYSSLTDNALGEDRLKEYVSTKTLNLLKDLL